MENNDIVGRKNDGIVVLLQDNAARRLTIATTNQVAAAMLGYVQGDLTNHPLDEILGERTRAMLHEEVEFAPDAPDVGDVLARQRTIRIKPREGNEITITHSIQRVLADGQNPKFHLILPDEKEARAQSQFKEFLQSNLESHQQLDAMTGLPDRATTEAYLKLLKSYAVSNNVSVAFAVVRLDRFQSNMLQYGSEGMAEILKHAANCCRTTFRTHDMIGKLGASAIGVVLLDISRESARLVFNRLRGQIRSHRMVFGGKQDFSVTISLAFDMLDTERGDTLLTRCEQAVSTIDKDARNSLIELTSE